MAEKVDKIILEREYIVPLRRKWLRTPKYRRVPKAVKALKQFIARHMKIYDKDLSKIKIDKYLNEELWFRGIQKPAGKIKVKARKFDSGLIKVELVEMPEKLKWKKSREEKLKEKVEKKKEEKKAEEKKEEEKAEIKEEKKPEEKKETQEKEKATVEAGLKKAEEKAKEIKHETKISRQPKHKFRQALQK